MRTTERSTSELRPPAAPIARPISTEPPPELTLPELMLHKEMVVRQLEKAKERTKALQLQEATSLSSTYKRPWVYDKQEAALFNPKRYGIVEASTKAGKTHGCILWLIEQAIKLEEGQSCWWVAPVNTQAKIAFRRMKRMLPKDSYTSTSNPMQIVLKENGAIIEFKSAEKPDNLYGDDVYAAVIDEASRCRQESWHAVRSTLTATNGPVRIIGNIKGRKNWFYDMARRAEGGDPDMHYAKLIAADAVAAGIVKAEEVEAARRDLPEAVFNELYLAIPNDDGGNPFGLKAIRERIRPMSTKPAVCYGVDLAKSHDWCVIIGLDEEGAVCFFERFQMPWEETENRILAAIGTGIPCLVDSTGVGDPIVERLQKKNPMVEGYKFTKTSKQQLMEGLAVAIQGGNVSYPEGVIVMELEAFEYSYGRTGVTYSAPEGQHDDTVCALALARCKLLSSEGARGFTDYYAQQALYADARAAGFNPDDPVSLAAYIAKRDAPKN